MAAETDGLVDPTLCGRWGELAVSGRMLFRPRGLALDLNGVVKALAVDEAVAALAGPALSLGGDLAVRGPVDVGAPGGRPIRVVAGGLATSGTASRGAHIVDTATGRPSESVLGTGDGVRERRVSQRTSPRRPVPPRRRRPGSSTSAASRAASSQSTARSSRTTSGRARPVRCRRARRARARRSGTRRGPRRRGVRRAQRRRLARPDARRQGAEPALAAFSVEDVHRFGGLLVGSLIGVHVLAIAADSYLPFSLTQLLVPFTSSYRPVWTGLGIAAAELLVALRSRTITERRLPYRFWRLAHYLNFAVWTFASLHGSWPGQIEAPSGSRSSTESRSRPCSCCCCGASPDGPSPRRASRRRAP